MTPDERAAALRQQADEVLDHIQLREHCSTIGDIIPTGSYFLDLMMYPDIDLYLPPTTPETLVAFGARLTRYDSVKRINFQKGDTGDLKNGLYIKSVIDHGDWERPWKIDIGSLSESIIEKKQAELIDLKNRMTPEHRHLILNVKHRLLTSEGRTPMYSGLYIYRGVVNQGLRELDQIVRYLKENNIDV